MIKIIDGEAELNLRGRIVDIIRWLVRNAERINRGSGAIRFAFGAGSLSVTVEEHQKIA
jgi:hypothetical protein